MQKDPDDTFIASPVFPFEHTVYVRVERKVDGNHPWFGVGSPVGYAVSYCPDGPFIQGRTIRVPFGQQTSVVVKAATGHPFYITTDRVGGSRELVGSLLQKSEQQLGSSFEIGIRTIDPVSTDDGIIVFTPKNRFLLNAQQRTTLSEGSDTVRIFYQCDYHPLMGGVLEIVPATDFIVPMECTAEARLGRGNPPVVLKAWKQMEGLNQPTFGVSSRDQQGRYFYIGEQGGKIWEVDTFTTIRGGNFRKDSPVDLLGKEKTQDPMEHAGMWDEYYLFMDVSQFMEGLYSMRSPYAGVNIEERGLLGMALHPEFHESHARNRGLFFLYMSSPATSLEEDHAGCVYRFTATRKPPEMHATGDPRTAARVLCVSEPFANHNGGTILFSPRDGMLYVGLGDGGAQGDPGNRAQDPKSLHGKILRLDVDAYDVNMPYRVPSDNPFISDGEGRSEIYAQGFRNPWGFDFDSRGRLIVADAGERIAEEVNEVSKGGFYGWSFREGSKRRKKPVGKESRALARKAVGPVFSYKHDKPRGFKNTLPRFAIVGAKVYTGVKHKRLRGTTIIADMSGWLGVLTRSSSKRYRLVGQGHLPAGEMIRALCKHSDGTIYALTHNKSKGETGGTVWEISL